MHKCRLHILLYLLVMFINSLIFVRELTGHRHRRYVSLCNVKKKRVNFVSNSIISRNIVLLIELDTVSSVIISDCTIL
jgi:hypothetical protein